MNTVITSEGTRCPHCLLQHQCVCEWLPKTQAPIHIALLMHENELDRETNTGKWLLQSLATSSSHVWQRTEPCTNLMALMASQQYDPYLLFPSDKSIDISEIKRQQRQATTNSTPLFIILDGTWQEAKKMLRKSPWLQALPQVHLEPTRVSTYQLRRNQQQGHLCTLEVCCEILDAVGEPNSSEQLLVFFEHYMQVFKADKSGHVFNAKTDV